jgi:two-component system, NarL family, sensor kinase
MSVRSASQCDPASMAAPGQEVAGPSPAEPDATLFRTLVESCRCMMAVVRLDRTVAYFNAFAEELTGYKAAEVREADYFERFVPEGIRAEVESHFTRAVGRDAQVEIEHPLVAKGGTRRWVICSFRSISDFADGPAVVLTAQDVTIQKRTEETLRHRTHDLGERIKELNCLFGLSRLDEDRDLALDGVLQGLVDILPSAWQYPGDTCARIVFEGREFRTWNFRPTDWRQTAPIAVYGEPAGRIEVHYLEEKPGAFEGPFLIEERRLIDALAQRLGRIAERTRLEKEVADISTREQQRIGQELHDGLGQELTGLGYLAETLCYDLSARGASESAVADMLAEGLERALEQVRAIARGLVPVEIDASGLPSALEQLTAEAQARCGIACRLVCGELPAVGDTAKAAQLFRIVQEAVNNAARHARARQITVEARTTAGQVVFEVRDDGVGISPDNGCSGGMGLRIMHYRAGVIGARLSIGPAPGGGTLVRCVLPQADRRNYQTAEARDGRQTQGTDR